MNPEQQEAARQCQRLWLEERAKEALRAQEPEEQEEMTPEEMGKRLIWLTNYTLEQMRSLQNLYSYQKERTTICVVTTLVAVALVFAVVFFR